jgi:uncharacterized NAD(P)/FAD-binding protein YdhS
MMEDVYDVTIVGGGASGVLFAIHLLRAARAPLRVALFEKSGRIAEGIAYGTHREEHVLNVNAGRMSAFEDDPLHFVRHLQRAIPGALPERIRHEFVGRLHYAGYLRATLDAVAARSAATLSVIEEEVVAIEPGAPLGVVGRFSGTSRARAVVLALGNWPRALPIADASVGAKPMLHAWDTRGIAGISDDETVVIVGAGLSMVDTLLTLATNGHRAPIHVVSRHGLFPLPHAEHGTLPINIDVLARLPLSRRVALLRTAAEHSMAQGEPWQWAMERVRPHVTALWQSLDEKAQRRFLRHGVRFWDVHRHRIAPSVAAVIDGLRASGQLISHKGAALRIAHDGRGARVTIGSRADARGTTTVLADRVVSSVGMETNLRRVSSALVRSMFERGLVRSGHHGIGFDTTMEGALIDREGSSSRNLWTIGSARIGQLWESVAVPELRVQAEALASRLVAPLSSEHP